MTKIRIQSNPYEKKIKYSRYDENNDDYIPVEDDSTSSLLISDSYVNCYFLSKAQDIVNQIIEEYGDELEIVFEGVTEEFEGLQELIKTDKVYETIKITKGAESLEDPQNVIKQFQDISKVISDIAGNYDVVDNDNLCSLNVLSAKSLCNNSVYKEIKQLHSFLGNKASFSKRAVEKKAEGITIEISEKESLFKDRKQILISELERIIAKYYCLGVNYGRHRDDRRDDRFDDRFDDPIRISIPFFKNFSNDLRSSLLSGINEETKIYLDYMYNDLINILIRTVTEKEYFVNIQDVVTISKAEYYEIVVDKCLKKNVDFFDSLGSWYYAEYVRLHLYKDHRKIFEEWAKKDLLNAIISKIDTLNPHLKRIKDEIDSLFERKKQLEQHRCDLDEQIQRIANTFSLKK